MKLEYDASGRIVFIGGQATAGNINKHGLLQATIMEARK